MPTILDYYEFAKLATAAYVRMEDAPSIDGSNLAIQANAQSRLPLALANKTFDKDSTEAKGSGESVWTIPEGGYHGNDETGFAATFFEKDGEKVLAIRGTEPGGEQFDLDLLQADLAGIGLLGMALSQAVSMVNYILRLTAKAGSDVTKLQVHTSTDVPSDLSYVTAKGGEDWSPGGVPTVLEQ